MRTTTRKISPAAPPKQSGNPVSSVVTLALWRFRRTWFLLLVTTLGLITAVIVACSIPLFSTVTGTAGMRNILNATPDSSTINVSVTNLGLSTPVVRDVLHQFDPLIQQHIGSYLQSAPDFAMSTDSATVISP